MGLLLGMVIVVVLLVRWVLLVLVLLKVHLHVARLVPPTIHHAVLRCLRLIEHGELVARALGNGRAGW